MLDQEGRVIGVVNSSFEEGQNLNLAIGIQTLNEFLAQEENPRQLKSAGSHVCWIVIAKRIVTAIADRR